MLTGAIVVVIIVVVGVVGDNLTSKLPVPLGHLVNVVIVHVVVVVVVVVVVFHVVVVVVEVGVVEDIKIITSLNT